MMQKQYEISNKLNNITQADEKFSITLNNLLNICSRAYELFEFEIKKPFDLFVNLKNVKNRSEWLSIMVRIKMRQISPSMFCQ